MEIKKSEFTISAPRVSMCPKDNKAEYAFIGRSNVGKSSLINMLCNHKGLAKTSATPGKTLLINHFIINNEWYLVRPSWLWLRQALKDRAEAVGADDQQLYPAASAVGKRLRSYRCASRPAEDRPRVRGLVGRE